MNRCNRCWHYWDEPGIDHDDGRCEDQHNDDLLHCHEKNGDCREFHTDEHCSECHEETDCRCLDPEG